ncbi:MAG: hypothetical protein ACLQU3_03565 [Limisphaerales bacterium]
MTPQPSAHHHHGHWKRRYHYAPEAFGTCYQTFVAPLNRPLNREAPRWTPAPPPEQAGDIFPHEHGIEETSDRPQLGSVCLLALALLIAILFLQQWIPYISSTPVPESSLPVPQKQFGFPGP